MISVIIPTYNREQSLKRTLQSLRKQLSEPFEVIVVDNAGNDSVRDIINNIAKLKVLNIKYVRYTKGGNWGARHQGVIESTGDILVFTDDDLTFSENWLSAYQNAFSKYPDMVAASGCVKPRWQIPPPKWLVNYIGDRKIFGIYAIIDLGNDFKSGSDGIIFGCNMAIRRSVFDTTGFRPELFGSQTIGSGESGLNKELSTNNKIIGYVPEAVTYHHISAERMTVKYIRRWAWHLGGSQMYTKWNGKKRTVAEMSREFVLILLEYCPCWFKNLFVFWSKAPGAIDIQFKASLGVCKLSYIWWMFHDRKVQEALDITDFRP